ncbi:Transcriptional regulator [Marinovum algicola DG 898]|nr:Transcriptional regulator [Marinovum algicola DG 898]
MEFTLFNLRHMRVFLECLRSGSVSVAAQRCHMSQPAATQAIAKLEASMGAPLVLRQPQAFGATPCGALFVRRAEAALDHLQRGAREARRGTASRARDTAGFERNVTPAQIRALIAIAGSGSFTVAARRLGLSQPTVHRAARALEQVAGVPFFKSTVAGVELTAAAQAFTLGAKLAQAEIRQGMEEIGRELGEDRGIFLLGSLPLARTAIVPRATHAMVSRFAGVQVRVIDGRYHELLRSLREGDLDCLIGALRHPLPADDVVQEELFQDRLAVVARPGHPLAGRTRVTLDEALAYPWVASPKDTPAGQYVFETLRIHERDRTPVRVVSSSLVMLRGILAQGDYVSIVSRHQVSVEIGAGLLTALDIPLAGSGRAIGLTHRRDWRPTRTQESFIGFLRQHSRPEPENTP